MRDELERQLNELIIPGLGQTFKGNDFRSLCGPGVYLMMADETVSYIGMASNVLRRISAEHHQLEAKETCTEVRIYRTETVSDAKKLETLLIHALKPKKNVYTSEGFELAKLLGVGHAIQYADRKIMRSDFVR